LSALGDRLKNVISKLVVLPEQVPVESTLDDKVGIIYEPKALIKAMQQSIEGF
jgi:hypothetical protein